MASIPSWPSEALKDELARVGVPSSLKSLISLAIQLDHRIRERRTEISTSARPTWMLPPAPVTPSPTNVPVPSDVEPMQLGLIRSPLTSEERLRRRRNNLCLYSGEAGHYLQSCPVRSSKFQSAPSTYFANCSAGNRSAHITLSLSLQISRKNIQVPTIIDSGACSCFMDNNFAQHHQSPLQAKAHQLSIHLADGSHLKSGPIIQEICPSWLYLILAIKNIYVWTIFHLPCSLTLWAFPGYKRTTLR